MKKKFLVIRFSKYSSPYVKGTFDDERKAEVYAELSNEIEKDMDGEYYVAVIKEKNS